MAKQDHIASLKLRIARMQRRGEAVPEGLASALIAALQGEQGRWLRTLSNDRFGRTKARKLRQRGGEFAFLPNRKS